MIKTPMLYDCVEMWLKANGSLISDYELRQCVKFVSKLRMPRFDLVCKRTERIIYSLICAVPTSETDGSIHIWEYQSGFDHDDHQYGMYGALVATIVMSNSSVYINDMSDDNEIVLLAADPHFFDKLQYEVQLIILRFTKGQNNE